MVSYIVCRHLRNNPTTKEDIERIQPVACFSSLSQAKKSTLIQDLIDRTANKFLKKKEWPLYCIFEVKNDFLSYKKPNLYDFSKTCYELYQDIATNEDGCFINTPIKTLYNKYYNSQMELIKWNNDKYEEMKIKNTVSRGMGYIYPESIGFKPY